MSPQSKDMISLEAVAGGLVMVGLMTILLGCSLWRLNEYVRIELTAMRATVASFERV